MSGTSKTITIRKTMLTKQMYGYLFILPALFFLIAFTYYPVIATFWQSLFAGHGSSPAKFVGLENYQSLMQDPVFIQSMKNTLFYALITIPLSCGLALLMALAVNRPCKGRGLLRSAFFLPSLLPMIAIANLWLFFYSPQTGVLNHWLNSLGFSSINWLGDPNVSLYSLMTVTIWREAGFFMIFYLAGLQQQDTKLYEAARIEGASTWHFFWKVQWPLLMPTTIFILINATLNAFRLADVVIAMTNGGPDNSTSLILFYIYQTAFSYWDTSSASAMTIVLLIVLATLAWLKFYFLDRKTWYQ
ncbi:carbohydrate ABC transporter permease [Acinetobacter rathckeae]|uniref:carbohydrate ABC transporter permease n=1 Tax=Acinetobacter rathckeae TaxID=2605272 RepID=UPI0018A2CFB4|nr:sugar ABC transporter permease [Acinetobacter rathckeae]MBF7688225.1 sugar ABC transporter permease [Acinetobacter rathckeae]MBF7695256.1 sugar ABC transporter permease [Acinetobacter rathckeae]